MTLCVFSDKWAVGQMGFWSNGTFFGLLGCRTNAQSEQWHGTMRKNATRRPNDEKYCHKEFLSLQVPCSAPPTNLHCNHLIPFAWASVVTCLRFNSPYIPVMFFCSLSFPSFQINFSTAAFCLPPCPALGSTLHRHHNAVLTVCFFKSSIYNFP